MNFGELLLPPDDPTGAQDSFRFGTITSTSPFRVKIDGDTDPIAATPTRLVEVGTEDRVFCQFHGRQLLIVGRVGGYGAMRRLEATNNLDFLLDSGIYHQSLNASATYSKNYPIDEAGMLEVFNATNVSGGSTAYIYQKYTHYLGVGSWVRTKYGVNWNPWRIVSRVIGWSNVLGSGNSVEPWVDRATPRVININGMIHLEGAMRMRGNGYTEGRIGNLPSWAAPAPSGYDLVYQCQGDLEGDSWALRIVPGSTEVRWQRYGPSAVAKDRWMPFAVSWPSNEII